KHLAWYISGLPHAKDLRPDVFRVESFEDVERLMQRFLELDPGDAPQGAEAQPAARDLGLDELTCDPASLANAAKPTAGSG
ncbi:MAG: hypothetical protein GWN29_13250, partial [Gammaproteobacteria bacterium]|nr:hypothetical protein [Gammaproteobacteria bacterium]